MTDKLTAEERLMKVLVDEGIVLKDATPTYSELLSVVAQLAKVDKPEVCPECENGIIRNFHKIGMDTMYSTDDPCPTCQGTGKKDKPDGEKDKSIRLVYVGNDHYQTTERVPDDSHSGSDYWSCYIPSVISKRLGLVPEEHKPYTLILKDADNG